MVKHILLIASTVIVCSCNQLDIKGMIMPTSEGVERRFEQSMQMNKDLRAEILPDRKSFRISSLHHSYSYEFLLY